MAILGTVGRYHAIKFGPVSFLMLIASGSVGGAAMTELAHQVRGKNEGWTFKSSALSGSLSLLIYNCMFNQAKIYRINPKLLLLLVLFYGFYYSDCNVAGGTVGTMAGASILSLLWFIIIFKVKFAIKFNIWDKIDYQLQILTKESLPQETKYGYPLAPATIPISKMQSLWLTFCNLYFLFANDDFVL